MKLKMCITSSLTFPAFRNFPSAPSLLRDFRDKPQLSDLWTKCNQSHHLATSALSRQLGANIVWQVVFLILQLSHTGCHLLQIMLMLLLCLMLRFSDTGSHMLLLWPCCTDIIVFIICFCSQSFLGAGPHWLVCLFSCLSVFCYSLFLQMLIIADSHLLLMLMMMMQLGNTDSHLILVLWTIV